MKLIPILFILVILFFIGVIVVGTTSIMEECEPEVIIAECSEPEVIYQTEIEYYPEYIPCEIPEVCVTYEAEYEDASIENETLMTEMSKVKTELNIVKNALEVVCDSTPQHVLCN